MESCSIKVLQPVCKEGTRGPIIAAKISKTRLPTASLEGEGHLWKGGGIRERTPTTHTQLVPDVTANIGQGEGITSLNSGRMLSSVISSLYGSGKKTAPLPCNQGQHTLQDPSLLECSFSFKIYAELEAENNVALEVCMPMLLIHCLVPSTYLYYSPIICFAESVCIY